MALLQMINSIRGKMREERITAIVSTDQLTTEIIDLINDAGSEILEEHDWPFDVRYDGKLRNPAKLVGTDVDIIAIVPDDNTTDGIAFTLQSDGADFTETRANASQLTGQYRSRILFTDSTTLANTPFVIEKITSGILNWGGALVNKSVYIDGGNTEGWTAFVHEHVLPSTCREVLSAYSAESDVPIQFIDRTQDFERQIYRTGNIFNDIPEVIMIGGTISNSYFVNSSGPGSYSIASASGIGATLWPIPENEITIDYTYRVQHADLSAATDVWTGVPKDVVRLIEWKALYYANITGIQTDKDLAREVERQVERRLGRALTNYNPQPNRRRVPTDFRNRGYINPRRRWSSQTVTAT